MASGKGTNIYKRLQSGAGKGGEVDLAQCPQASSSMLGRSRLPVSSFFCLALSSSFSNNTLPTP